jgi:hypothetical protein
LRAERPQHPSVHAPVEDEDEDEVEVDDED